MTWVYDPRMREKLVEASNWVPLHHAFTGDAAEFVRMVWPNLLVNRRITTNSPSRRDPLGQTSRLQLYHDQVTNCTMLRLDDVYTPLLDPPGMVTYVLIEWPEHFRVRES